MAYQPYFTISPALLSLGEEIAALRERILGSPVGLSWIPALQKDTRTRNGHASTAIEGNPLTLEEVRALEEGRQVTASPSRFQREVTNYFAGLRYVEKQAGLKEVRHEHLFELHRLLAADVMDQGRAGAYRTIGVRVSKRESVCHLSILSAKPFENGVKCSGEKRLKNTASRLKSTKLLFKVRKSG